MFKRDFIFIQMGALPLLYRRRVHISPSGNTRPAGHENFTWILHSYGIIYNKDLILSPN